MAHGDFPRRGLWVEPGDCRFNVGIRAITVLPVDETPKVGLFVKPGGATWIHAGIADPEMKTRLADLEGTVSMARPLILVDSSSTRPRQSGPPTSKRNPHPSHDDRKLGTKTQSGRRI